MFQSTCLEWINQATQSAVSSDTDIMHDCNKQGIEAENYSREWETEKWFDFIVNPHVCMGIFGKTQTAETAD